MQTSFNITSDNFNQEIYRKLYLSLNPCQTAKDLSHELDVWENPYYIVLERIPLTFSIAVFMTKLFLLNPVEKNKDNCLIATQSFIGNIKNVERICKISIDRIRKIEEIEKIYMTSLEIIKKISPTTSVKVNLKEFKELNGILEPVGRMRFIRQRDEYFNL